MLKIRVNDRFDFELLRVKDDLKVNGNTINIDLSSINSTTFHVLHENRSYNAELIELDTVGKSCTVRINSNVYTMSISDQFDQLLHRLGMDNLTSNAISELKAPMPGMVLKVLVAEGEAVVKGANLVVLEAMKMENIIKSPGDAVVKSIRVISGDKVEKNQVMVIFH